MIGDRLGGLIEDEDFEDLFSPIGRPAISPTVLSLVTIFQMLEKRPDRQAAEDVRMRIDWKYALHLPLEDAGFHFTNLSHFRKRIIEHGAEYRVFERLLSKLVELGLVRRRGRQRTDSTYVLGVVADLSRLELVWETLRTALKAIQKRNEGWLEQAVPEAYLQRYLIKRSDYNSTESQTRQELEQAGADGFWLLEQIRSAPKALQELEEVKILRTVWEQQFERDDQDQYRGPRQKLNPHDLIQNPHEPQVRYRKKRGKPWKGYSAQITETAEARGEPNFITNIAATDAQMADRIALPEVQRRLAVRQLLPSEQVVDQNYLSGQRIYASQEQGIRLVGPILAQRGPEGFKLNDFQIDLRRQQAICPAGKTSVAFSINTTKAVPHYQFRFGKQCRSCPLSKQCTQSKNGRNLHFGFYHPYVVQQRKFMQTDEFHQIMKSRPAVEGTISELVRRGIRQARYRGQPKVNLQIIFTAVAVNVLRLCRFWSCNRQPSWLGA